jgi:predicted phage tail protein
METQSVFLTGSFKDLKSAELAYSKLREKGYSDNEINIIMSDESKKRYIKDDKNQETKLGNKAKEGAGAGAAVGGVIGATAGIVAAIGTSLLIPGLGIIIAGPIAAGLAGAGAGGITGGVVGALVGAGIPKERATRYEQGIKNGEIVIAVDVHSEDDAIYFEKEWQNYGNDISR